MSFTSIFNVYRNLELLINDEIKKHEDGLRSSLSMIPSVTLQVFSKSNFVVRYDVKADNAFYAVVTIDYRRKEHRIEVQNCSAHDVYGGFRVIFEEFRTKRWSIYSYPYIEFKDDLEDYAKLSSNIFFAYNKIIDIKLSRQLAIILKEICKNENLDLRIEEKEGDNNIFILSKTGHQFCVTMYDRQIKVNDQIVSAPFTHDLRKFKYNHVLSALNKTDIFKTNDNK